MLIAGFPAGSFQANCYVLAVAAGAEGDGATPAPCVVIDPGEGAEEPLAAVLAEHRLAPVAVLVTHGHLDHTASASAVGRRYGIPVGIHPGDEYMLTDPGAALSPQLRAALAAAGDTWRTAGPPDDVRRLVDGEDLGLAGLPLSVIHNPGHTPGSVTYRLAGGPAGPDGEPARPELLFTGDTLFAGSIGRTDLAGGSMPQELVSIADRLLTRPDDAIVLPGHGPGTTVAAERDGNPFLTADAIAQARAALPLPADRDTDVPDPEGS